MLSALEKVKDALLSVSDNVYHYEAHTKRKSYIVWAEDSEIAALHVDGVKHGQTIEGTIDLFTKDEDDDLFSDIPEALNGAGIGWSLNSTQYEEETEYIHAEWVFHVRQIYEDAFMPPPIEGDDDP